MICSQRGAGDELLVFLHGSSPGDHAATQLRALAATARITVGFADRTVDDRYRESLARLGIAGVPPATESLSVVDFICAALRHVPDANIVVLQAGVTLEMGWYEVLREAESDDPTTATVSAAVVSNARATATSTAVDRSVARGYPPIPIPRWGCVLLRREAVELGLATRRAAIPSSASFIGALETLVSLPGFVHRLAAPVAVSGAQDGTDRNELGPGARRVLDTLETQGEALSILVDLRCCAFPMSGTQVQVLQLVHALAATGGVDLSALLPERVHSSLANEVARLPPSVQRTTAKALPSRRPHVFHHPHQLLRESELAEAVSFGERLVITQQDMILSRNPAYFSSRRDWLRLREMTDIAFLVADHVAFFSPHALRDALSEGVLSEDKASVVPLGTEHTGELPDASYELPEYLSRRLRQPFLLVLGNAYLHKNRIHALQIFESLTRRTKWDGMLVLAGGHPPVGGSKQLEREYLAAHPALEKRVVDVGPVDEAEKRKLYRDAALLVYPSLYEGFGLVPFEAAALGTPAAYSHRSALADFLPAEGALLQGWDADASAERIAHVLGDEVAQRKIVEAIRAAGRPLTWKRTAEAYLDIYRLVVAKPVGFSLALGDFALGPTSATLAPSEQRLLKAYRESSALRATLDSLVSAGIATRRRVRSVAARRPSR